jgi:hypothetical protein
VNQRLKINTIHILTNKGEQKENEEKNEYYLDDLQILQ